MKLSFLPLFGLAGGVFGAPVARPNHPLFTRQNPGDVVETIVTYFLTPDRPANGTSSPSGNTDSSSGNSTEVQPVLAGPGADVNEPQYVATAPPSATASSTAAPIASDSSLPSGSASSASGKCGANAPVILVKNASPDIICYMVELNPSSHPQPLDVSCGPGNGISVPAKAESEFCPGEGFIGALTAFHEGGNTRGSRFEFNFGGGENFYDEDWEIGMDSATLGAAGADKVQGHKDIFKKIDEAFQAADEGTKSELQATGLLTLDGGHVTKAKMSKDAPVSYVKFLQVDAKLQGYVVPGSVSGDQSQHGDLAGSEAKSMADSFSWATENKVMVITNY